MRSAGYDVRENDPFKTQIAVSFSEREGSPIAHRIRLMWQEMRSQIIDRFPTAP
jgi:hypothetical protein